MLNIEDGETQWIDTVDALVEEGRRAAVGDLRAVSRTLTAQALTLDAIFTRLVERAAINMGDYPQAFERYMRLALKAQANSRATFEALARIHQPREQTVKHVTVNEGGQAVVAENFHHHAGGGNAKTTEQPYEPCAALPGANPLGNAVPVPSGERAEAMPPARRSRRKRSAQR
jgi:hypothetical protein